MNPEIIKYYNSICPECGDYYPGHATGGADICTCDRSDGIDTLLIALNESVKLQSHYAGLLNMYDGGKRMQFSDSEQWIERLKQTGTIPK